MSETQPEQPEQSNPSPASVPTSANGSWLSRNWKYVPIILAVIGWAWGAIESYRKGEPIPQPPAIDLPLPVVAEQPGPIDYEGCRFSGCDHHDHGGPQQQVAQARWPSDRITYSIDYASAKGMSPPLADASIQAALKQATNWWSEQLQIEFLEVPFGTAAMIPIRFERIDGPGGVLAEAFLADGTNNAKPLRFDFGERWTAGAPAANLVSLPTVGCHELGHSLGLGHDSQSAPAVMRPTYTSSIPREQERDIGRMVQLGYRRREKVPPPATDVIPIQVQVKTDDVIEALKKNGFTVTKP